MSWWEGKESVSDWRGWHFDPVRAALSNVRGRQTREDVLIFTCQYSYTDRWILHERREEELEGR